jgi:hypothetical protein
VNAEPSVAALLAYGAGTTNVPLGPCTQLMAPVLAAEFRVTAPGGEARFAVPIPNDTGLLGVALFAQGATLGAFGTWNGIELSRGLRFDIGR